MASDFRVGPVTDREHADQIVVLGLPECFFHKISVQAGLNDRISAPIGKIRDQDILAEPVDIPADAVIVFAESQGNVPVFSFKAQVVQILGQVQVFADLRVTLTHLAFLGPAPSLLPDLSPHLVQRSLELLQLGLESVSLLGRRERVVRHHDGTFFIPVFPGRPPGDKPVIFPVLFCKLFVFCCIHPAG